MSQVTDKVHMDHLRRREAAPRQLFEKWDSEDLEKISYPLGKRVTFFDASAMAALKEEAAGLKEKIGKMHKLVVDDVIWLNFEKRMETLSSIRLKMRKATLKGPFLRVNAISWFSDSKRLLGVADSNRLIEWDACGGNRLWFTTLYEAITACAYAPSGKTIALACPKYCAIFDYEEIQPRKRGIEDTIRARLRHKDCVSGCRFVDEYHVLTSSLDKLCVLWDANPQQRIYIFNWHQAAVMSLAVSKGNNTFISGSQDRTAILWDLRSKNYCHVYNGYENAVNVVAYSPDCKTFCTGSSDKCCWIDIRTQQPLKTFALERTTNHSNSAVTSIDFSSSGRLLFSGYDDFNSYIWDSLKGSRVGVLTGHGCKVTCLAVSPDGSSVATGSLDKRVRLWS